MDLIFYPIKPARNSASGGALGKFLQYYIVGRTFEQLFNRGILKVESSHNRQHHYLYTDLSILGDPT